VHLVPDGGHMAVHLDAPFGDDLFGGAAGAQPLLAHDLLNAFQCHSFLLLVRLPALLRVSRHAPGGTHFCAQSRDRNSFPLVSSWGQNLSPNHALACGSHTLGVKFPCLCPSHPHMSAGWDGDCKFSLLPWVPRAFRPFCRG